MSFPVPLPSTFMPLPLAIMIPFMGIQSGVMAQQFGMNFQYGKRKISAMSNEEFNELTPEKMQADFSRQIKGMIPTFEASLQDMRPFQRMIFTEMLAVMKEAIDLGINVAKAGVDPLAHIFGEHIHPSGTGGPTPFGAPSPTNIPSPQPDFQAPFVSPTNEPSPQPDFSEPVVAFIYKSKTVQRTVSQHKIHLRAMTSIMEKVCSKDYTGTQSCSSHINDIYVYRRQFHASAGYWI